MAIHPASAGGQNPAYRRTGDACVMAGPWNSAGRPSHGSKPAAVDVCSFVIMKRAGITLAYAFNYHFAMAGLRLVGPFGTHPRRNENGRRRPCLAGRYVTLLIRRNVLPAAQRAGPRGGVADIRPIRRGRSGPRSSPCSRPPRSPSRTSRRCRPGRRPRRMRAGPNWSRTPDPRWSPST